MLSIASASHHMYLPLSGASNVLITVEHGGISTPFPWTHTPDISPLTGTHWASDLYIAPLALSLAEHLNAPCVIAHFSRLLVDPNRAPSAPHFIPNQVVDSKHNIRFDRPTRGERRERIRRLYLPYHLAVDRVARHYNSVTILSLHSFTDNYGGVSRIHEAGVLFNEDAAGADTFLDSLRDQGVDARPNWPYSGHDGFIFSAETHARRHNIRHTVEIELRQDRLLDPDFSSRSLSALSNALTALSCRL